MNRRVVLAAIIVAAGVTPAFAQVSTAAEKRNKVRQETASVYPYALSGTTETLVGLIASQDAKAVHMTWVAASTDSARLAFKVSSPLDSGSARSAVLQLNGLTNKSTAGVNLTFGRTPVPSVEEAGRIAGRLADACRKARLTKADASCSLADLFGAEELDNLLQPYLAPSWFLSLEGEGGTQMFKWADAATLDAAGARRWSTSASAIAGVLWHQDTVYTSGGLRFERSYEASPNRAICRAPAPVACEMKAFGEPPASVRRIFEIETRRYLGPNAGIGSIFRRDWKNDETSVEVPLYVVKDKDGGLAGGISTGYLWTSTERGWRFGIFVGQTFGLSR